MLKVSNSLYHFIGTDDGRILQYHTKEDLFLSRIFSFKFIQTSSQALAKKNKIYALASYDELLCASGYGGEIILINIYTRAKKISLFHSKSSVSSLVFLDKNTLVASNVNGEIYIYDIPTQNYKKYITTKTEIQGVLHLQQEGILLIYAHDNYLTLIDLKEQTLLKQKFLHLKAVVEHIKMQEKGLYITFKDQTSTTLSYQEILLHLTLLRDEIAKKANSGYITKVKQKNTMIVSKKKDQKPSCTLLEKAYALNDFKLCYEIIDKYEILDTQLSFLLEKHWKKLLLESQEYALQGDAKRIISSFGELLFVESRSAVVGDLLRLSFFQKIEILLDAMLHNSAQNIIYSYIDIFGYDCEIAQKIKKYERETKEKIAILTHKEDRKSRTFWWGYFHEHI